MKLRTQELQQLKLTRNTGIVDKGQSSTNGKWEVFENLNGHSRDFKNGCKPMPADSDVAQSSQPRVEMSARSKSRRIQANRSKRKTVRAEEPAACISPKGSTSKLQTSSGEE